MKQKNNVSRSLSTILFYSSGWDGVQNHQSPDSSATFCSAAPSQSQTATLVSIPLNVKNIKRSDHDQVYARIIYFDKDEFHLSKRSVLLNVYWDEPLSKQTFLIVSWKFQMGPKWVLRTVHYYSRFSTSRNFIESASWTVRITNWLTIC